MVLNFLIQVHVMSYFDDLNKGYFSFFKRAAQVAVCPYTGTFNAIYRGNDDNIPAAAVITGVLTFIVPVLPTLFSFTFELAIIASTLAVASMFLLYPLALLGDCVSSSKHNNLPQCAN